MVGWLERSFLAFQNPPPPTKEYPEAMQISVTLPDDIDPKAVDALEKAITDAGGEWEIEDEIPEEMPPPMPPGAAGAMMQAQGAQALRPPGLG